MRADRDLSSAYQNPNGSVAIGVWPQAGFSSIAYRLANLSVPRIGALIMVSALFYLV
jgi:hypothetical protein